MLLVVSYYTCLAQQCMASRDHLLISVVTNDQNKVNMTCFHLLGHAIILLIQRIQYFSDIKLAYIHKLNSSIHRSIENPLQVKVAVKTWLVSLIAAREFTESIKYHDFQTVTSPTHDKHITIKQCIIVTDESGNCP